VVCVSEVSSAGSGTGDKGVRWARDVKREPSEQQEERHREERRSEGGVTGNEPPTEGRSVQGQDAVVMAVLVSVVPHGKGLALEARIVVAAPPEYVDWAEARPQRLRKDAEQLIKEAHDRLAERFADAITANAWQAATANWRVIDFGGFDSAAERVAALDGWTHEQAGMWLAPSAEAAGMPADFAGGAGALIGYAIPLPADKVLGDLSQIIRVAGIVVACMTGHVAWAIASTKSLAHEELVKDMAKLLAAAADKSIAVTSKTELQPARDDIGLLRSRAPASSSHKPASDVKTYGSAY
jgi:hypothetical protein